MIAVDVDQWKIYVEPWEAADEESGDDGDEHQGQPLLSTSPSSALSHLRKVKCHPV